MGRDHRKKAKYSASLRSKRAQRRRGLFKGAPYLGGGRVAFRFGAMTELPPNGPSASVPTAPRRRRTALAVLLLVSFVAVAWMVAPLLVGLALGTVMAFSAQPLHERIRGRIPRRPRLASAVTTLIG